MFGDDSITWIGWLSRSSLIDSSNAELIFLSLFEVTNFRLAYRSSSFAAFSPISCMLALLFDNIIGYRCSTILNQSPWKRIHSWPSMTNAGDQNHHSWTFFKNNHQYASQHFTKVFGNNSMKSLRAFVSNIIAHKNVECSKFFFSF